MSGCDFRFLTAHSVRVKIILLRYRFLRLTENVEHHRGPGSVSWLCQLPTVWAHLAVQAICALFAFLGGNMRKIGIIMGSDSDLPIVQKAVDTLKAFDVPYEVHIFSAHRTPEQAREFSANARKNGFGAIIAAAGMAAHLAGAIAANTTLPVVGIPCKGATLDGMDALLSTVQMPSGIPVATVAINGAVNAALLCIQMLAIEDSLLAEKLDEKRQKDTAAVLEKDRTIAASL